MLLHPLNELLFGHHHAVADFENGEDNGAPTKPSFGFVGRGGTAERTSFRPLAGSEGCEACADDVHQLICAGWSDAERFCHCLCIEEQRQVIVGFELRCFHIESFHRIFLSHTPYSFLPQVVCGVVTLLVRLLRIGGPGGTSLREYLLRWWVFS